jgi:hypothetical protein
MKHDQLNVWPFSLLAAALLRLYGGVIYYDLRTAGKIGVAWGKKRQKERALTSPKTSALAFISVLPWRINDEGILTLVK